MGQTDARFRALIGHSLSLSIFSVSLHLVDANDTILGVADLSP